MQLFDISGTLIFLDPREIVFQCDIISGMDCKTLSGQLGFFLAKEFWGGVFHMATLTIQISC